MARYTWDDWFGRDRFVLLHGIDYLCEQMSMQQQVRNAASQRGLRVTVSAIPGGLRIEVTNSKKEVASA